MSDTEYRKWGVMTDQELVQRIAGIIDPMGEMEDVEKRAQGIVRLVKANVTCIGDTERGCY